MNRREFICVSMIVGAGIAATGGGLFWLDRRRFLGSELFEAIAPDVRWHSSHLLRFLNTLGASERRALLKSFEKESDLPPDEILRELRWVSSNILTYPFRDKSDFDYHAIVQWVSKNLDIEERYINSDTTFSLEARIVGALFEELWDSLTYDQRLELLAEIDEESSIADKAAIASLGGSAALAALSATVYFTGFAFYATMSTVMFTVAGFFGVTLPFAAYAGTSTLIAVLSGPIGWALLTIGAVSGIALLGRANVSKTTAFVLQVHMLKVERILAEDQEWRFRKYLPQ